MKIGKGTYLQDALLDLVLEVLDLLFGNKRNLLADRVVLEVLLEDRVERSGPGRGFSRHGPVLGSGVLLLESGDLGRESRETLSVRGERGCLKEGRV